MKVLINFNEYLGGGETLLLRLAEAMSATPLKIISSSNSYIMEQAEKTLLKNTELCKYYGDYNFSYLSKDEKLTFLSWLNDSLPKTGGDIKVVTFCLRDLQNIVAMVKKYNRKDICVVHLLLHPLDHLFMAQTIGDKILSKIKYVARFSRKEAIDINASILKHVADAGGLVSMNVNVSKRLKIDTGIDLQESNIIPLPFCDFNELKLVKVTSHEKNCVVKIVWLGRIVDFKIPAIKSMIDFVASTSGYSFDIIGYGNEKIINQYISNKGVENKVQIIGKIPHNELNSVLSKYHIGYGMGTSMIELTVAGLPTIVALANPDFKSFSTPVSAGLVFEQGYGDVGDDLYCQEADNCFPSITDSVERIQKNRLDIFERSLSKVIEFFSLTENISNYILRIDNAKPLTFDNVEIPNVNCVRKALFRVIS